MIDTQQTCPESCEYRSYHYTTCRMSDKALLKRYKQMLRTMDVLDLQVSFANKEAAKALGAKWDGDRQVWYADLTYAIALARFWPAHLNVACFTQALQEELRESYVPYEQDALYFRQCFVPLGGGVYEHINKK